MADLAAGMTARELVPGNPDEVDRLAARLTVLGSGMSDAAGKLSNLGSAGWRGPAADAFGDLLDKQPDKFRKAGSAFSEAASALRSYTAVLREAQAAAGRAVTAFEGAQRETDGWRTQRNTYDTAARAAKDAGDPPPSGPEPPAGDPGGSERAASQRLLADARERVRTQGRLAADKLGAAADTAPHKPGLFHRIISGVGDFFGGVWEGLKGIADTLVMLAKLSTIRMLIDPKGWARDVTDLAKGLWWGVTHPVEFLKVMTDWETWKTNPLRAFGKLIPDIVIAIATAGTGTAASGASRGIRGVKALKDAAKGARGAHHLPDPEPWPTKPPVPKPPTPKPGGWKRGDDIYAQTKAGNDPPWNTVRRRYWKNAASDPQTAAQWDPANLERMKKGLAPQRYNPDKGGIESMELSHEPIPQRDGGRDVVPRWPQDHAAVDPHRHVNY